MRRRLVFAFPRPKVAEALRFESFSDEVCALCGFEIEPLWALDAEGLVAAVCERRAELAWAPPVPAVELEMRAGSVPLVAVGRDGSVAYHGALVVPRDSPRQRTKDLAGARVAWVSKSSAAGYLVPRLYLASKGLDPATMFAEQRFAGTHEAALSMLLAGEVDVAAVYARVDPRDATKFEVAAPGSLVRAVARVGPLPSDVITCTGLDAGDRATVTRALLGVSEESLQPLRTIANVTRFEPMPFGHLDPVRKMAVAARGLGVRLVSWWHPLYGYPRRSWTPTVRGARALRWRTATRAVDPEAVNFGISM
jgi:phosphate/phosphite/phosphonate ABC transporter binding protein